jgi:autotransporter passenger strand-loop-strand repeat protein
VASGGTESVFSGGKAISATISSGGFDIVSSGGVDSATTVQSGAIQQIFSRGTAKGAIVFGGPLQAQQVFAGGTALNTTLHADRRLDGFASVTSIVGVVEDVVEAGGTSVLTKVLSGGIQDIFLGTAINTTVSSGGHQDVTGGFTRSQWSAAAASRKSFPAARPGPPQSAAAAFR